MLGSQQNDQSTLPSRESVQFNYNQGACYKRRATSYYCDLHVHVCYEPITSQQNVFRRNLFNLSIHSSKCHEQPWRRVIVSRRHVDATFGPTKMADFDAYAYPLSSNTFVTWHEEPSKWVRKSVHLPSLRNCVKIDHDHSMCRQP